MEIQLTIKLITYEMQIKLRKQPQIKAKHKSLTIKLNGRL